MCISQVEVFSQFQERQWRVCFLIVKPCAGQHCALASRLVAMLNVRVSFRGI
jgi:hypothetical protein